MDYTQLIESRSLKVTELEALTALVATENRKLSTYEQTAFDNITNDIKKLDADIEEKRTADIKKTNIKTNNNKKMENKFSIRSFLNNLSEGRNFSETEQELIEQGKQGFLKAGLSFRGTALPFETRADIAVTAGSGGINVPEDKFDILMPLRNKLVFAKAGATMLTGLIGDISIPCMTGTTALWKGENTTAADGTNGFIEVTLAPKRLTSYLAVSKQLLMQDANGVDAKLTEDLINAIKDKLESTVLGTAAGSTTQPAGIFYGSNYTNGGVVVSGATTWAKTVALETGINANNGDVDSMYYIIHPNTLGSMKTTAKAANTAAFIADNGTINGYPYIKSNLMPTVSTGKGIAFGNFKDVYVAQWGSIDVTVDNLTGAKDGLIYFIINSYWDVKAIRTASIATGWLV
jgi:HK97 family phage major capsid protein